MSEKISRRKILGAGIAAGAGLISGMNLKGSDIKKTSFPWKYQALDPNKTTNRAYQSYFKGGCMYGVFESIVAQVAEKLGKPYTDFPFQMSTYGGGGVAGWGTLCGTCNGAAMAISMFTTGKVRSQLISEVFAWYEKTLFPMYLPENPKKVKKDFKMPVSKSGSTLCHISISTWAKTVGLGIESKESKERCARLVADIAGYTANLLNDNLVGRFVPKNQINQDAKSCLECHGIKNVKSKGPGVVSKMTCTTCHEDHNK